MWTEILYLYLLSVAAFLCVSIAIALYEEWMIKHNLVSCSIWLGSVENIRHLVLIALIPVLNIFATMFSIGYFIVEHLPYVADDIRRKKQNDLVSKKFD